MTTATMTMSIRHLKNSVKDILRYSIETGTRLNIMACGSPGLGKTVLLKAAVSELSEELGMDIIILMRHPVTDSDVDYGGQPAIVNGEAVHLPYLKLREFLTAEKHTVVFLDDLGQAVRSVQAALMQTTQERSINSFKVSEFVHFVAATNGANDKSGVTGILKSLADRFTSVNVTVDPDYFADYLRDNHSDLPEVEAFIRYRPGHLTGEYLDADQKAGRIGAGNPSPRSVENVTHLLRSLKEQEALTAFMAGTVGKPFTSEFIGFRKVYKTVTMYAACIADPTTARLPQGVDGNYAQMGMLCQKAKRGDMTPIAQYVQRCGHEYAAYFWMLLERSRSELCETKAYQEWRMVQNY